MDLTRIVVDPASYANFDLVQKSLGYRARSIAEKKVAKRMDALGTLALNAYKSKVPVDTFHLRDTNLTRSPRVFTRLDREIVVSVSGSHTGRRGNTMDSGQLADFLNLGTSPRGNSYRRSRTSANIPPYRSIARRSPTAGWITSARLAYAAARRGA